jgi:methionyl-tRNA synthetase
VERKQIEQWVREERLVFSDESPIKLYCEKCGKYITTGRFCEQCKKDNASSFSAAGRKDEGSEGTSDPGKGSGSRMYTFRN